MKILMVLTSHDRLGDSGEKTGFWLEEFAAPYYVFKDVGAEITLASPKGGQPPLDPKSDAPENRTEATDRFANDQQTRTALENTLKLSQVSADDFDAVFYPGGHGPLWDLAEDRDSVALIEAMYATGKPVAAVCHAPCVFRHAKKTDGSPLVEGKRVTGFSNSEEKAIGLTDIVPFLVEDELTAKGGRYSKGEDWQSHLAEDGNLITGQNPASSMAAAKAVLKQLGRINYPFERSETMEKVKVGHYLKVKTRFPEFMEAVETMGETARQEGPIDEKNSQLVQLAGAAAIRSEGAVHSHTRRALQTGATADEIYHTLILLTSTIGFPNVMAAMSWAEDIIDNPE